MNEGRANMERVIRHYEQQRAEALRLKKEAEIVLPYMRAAIEELEAQVGNAEPVAEVETHQPAEMAPAPKRPTLLMAAGDEADHAEVEEEFEEEFEVEAEDAESKPSFGRASIASLIEQKKKSAAG